MTSRSAVSCPNVCSCPIDFAGSPVATGSASIPCARSTSAAPCFPNRRSRASGGSAARSPIVWTPNSRRTAAVFSPTPHSREIGSGARNAASSPGGTTTSPSGLRRSDPIFATSFVAATPTEAVSPTSSWTVALDRPGDRLAVAEQRPRPGHVEERLVDGDRLHLGREPAEDRHDLAAGRLVPAPVHRQEHAAAGRAGTRSAAASRSGRRTRGPRSWPPRPRPAASDRSRRRSPASRAAPAGRAAPPRRRTRRGRRGGWSGRSRANSAPRARTPARDAGCYALRTVSRCSRGKMAHGTAIEEPRHGDGRTHARLPGRDVRRAPGRARGAPPGAVGLRPHERPRGGRVPPDRRPRATGPRLLQPSRRCLPPGPLLAR